MLDRPLIAVMSCYPRAAQRAALRETWIPAVRKYADVKFFLGYRSATALPYLYAEDEVAVPAPDGYDGIPLKVQRICEYAALLDYPRVAKVDDDVYIVPGRFPDLLRLAEPYDYVGRCRGPYGNYPAHFASGFFYLLSNNAASYVATTRWNNDWMDERFVANTLAFWNIFGYNDPVNYIVSGPHIRPSDVPKRAIICNGTVFCEYYPNQIREMHEVFANTGPVTREHPGLKEVQRVVVTEQILYTPPADKIPADKLEKARRYERTSNALLR